MTKRLGAVFQNRINRINELILFDKSLNVEATYFVGMANELSLSYSKKEAKKIIKLIQKNNLEVGVHGIAWDNKPLMIKEYEQFKELSGKENFGIRNHYLRKNDNTFDYMSEIGYSFDSTDIGLKNPEKIGKMIEFPVGIMDVDILALDSIDFEKVKAKTISVFAEAKNRKLDYFTVIFHDNYFSAHYPLHLKWYKWLIFWVAEQGHEFVSFKSAVAQLNKSE